MALPGPSKILLIALLCCGLPLSGCISNTDMPLREMHSAKGSATRVFVPDPQPSQIWPKVMEAIVESKRPLSASYVESIFSRYDKSGEHWRMVNWTETGTAHRYYLAFKYEARSCEDAGRLLLPIGDVCKDRKSFSEFAVLADNNIYPPLSDREFDRLTCLSVEKLVKHLKDNGWAAPAIEYHGPMHANQIREFDTLISGHALLYFSPTLDTGVYCTNKITLYRSYPEALE